jgi:hypothetical protein
VHVDGEDPAFGGNGQVDFRTNVMSLDIGASIPNGSMTETELLVGGNLYLQVTADSHKLAAVPVTVSAPAASDTVSIQQLVTAASH